MVIATTLLVFAALTGAAAAGALLVKPYSRPTGQITNQRTVVERQARAHVRQLRALQVRLRRAERRADMLTRRVRNSRPSPGAGSRQPPRRRRTPSTARRRR